MIQIDNPDEIYSWDTIELWNAIQLLEDEDKQDHYEELQQIKYGINIQVPIIYIIKDWTEEYPNNKRIAIKGHGKHSIQDYYDEVDERNTLMRKIILSTIEKPTNEPRN